MKHGVYTTLHGTESADSHSDAVNSR